MGRTFSIVQLMVSKSIVAGVMALLVLVFTSCERVYFGADGASRDPQLNLDYLWTQADEQYTYFELKGVNWDSLHTFYAGQLSDGMSEDSLFLVLGAMLSELKDDHVNLFSPFNVSRFGVQYLAPDQFDWRRLQDYYLGYDYYISGPFAHTFLDSGRLAYVRMSSFTGNISSINLDVLLERYRDTEGLILDLRENGGGRISDVYALLSRFIDEEVLLYYSQIKNGPGWGELTEPQPVYLQPHSGTTYLKPVVLLTDRGTYSSGSLTALGAHAIERITLLGDTTGGGLGMPNGGQLPNGWTYRFSITRTLNLALQQDWEYGVPPDTTVRLDPSAPNTDEILEAAMAILR